LLEYTLFSRSKGLRPKLIQELGKVLNIDDDSIIPLCAAAESIHNASLVHDDIQDRSITRRNKPSVWKKFGESQTISLGDLLFSLAFSVLSALPVTHNNMISAKLSETCIKLSNGQIIEADARKKEKIDLNTYITIATLKTGSLFQFCIEAPILLSRYTHIDDTAIQKISSLIGVLYQSVDDIKDMSDASLDEEEELKTSFVTAILSDNFNEIEYNRFIKVLRSNKEKAYEIFTENNISALLHDTQMNMFNELLHHIKNIQQKEISDCLYHTIVPLCKNNIT
jgi:geranylgeranyl pyrophosphate synthase